MIPIIAIVGRPNVGKSTFFNRLVGFQKAIVHDMPGVTRDRNYGQASLAGRPVTVVDTGGFDTEEPGSMLARVREQTLLAIDEADLTIFLTDGRQGLTPQDRELADILRRSGRAFVLAVNKIDNPDKESLLTEFHELGLAPIFPVSAAHGFGLHNLTSRLAEMLPEAMDEPERPDLIRVSVIGRPNVGKSSLINRLTGQQRAVVADQPGTTRDAVDIEMERGGRHFLFVDTAGIRRKGKVSAKVEKFSVMRALRSLDRSDIAVLMIDSVEGVTDQDAHVAGYAVERGRAVVMMFNKWDLVKDKHQAEKQIKAYFDLKLRFLAFAPRLSASALTGQKVERLFPILEDVFAQYTFQATTGRINKVLEQAVESHTPPYVGRTRLKFYYGVQTGNRPPTFVLFANKPHKMHFSYHRYLTNSFKEAFGLDKVPIRVQVRSRH